MTIPQKNGGAELQKIWYDPAVNAEYLRFVLHVALQHACFTGEREFYRLVVQGKTKTRKEIRMKKITKYITNIIAGCLFLALLAVNIQVGIGSGLPGLGETSVNEAKAGNCPEGTEICGTVDFPPRVPGGPIIIIVDYGEPLVVTPE